MSSSTARALGQLARRAGARPLRRRAAPRASAGHRSTPRAVPHPRVASHRHIASTAYARRTAEGGGKGEASTTELHSLFHEQMQEIQSEREEIFGTTAADDVSDGPDLSQTAKSYFEATPGERPSSALPSAPAASTAHNSPPGWSAEEAEEATAVRESLYAFSDAERGAWKSAEGAAHKMRRIRQLVAEHDANAAEAASPPPDATAGTHPPPSPFSHLTPRGDGVSMVDVGDKTVTRRVAVARAVVVFPPEVLAAFQIDASNNEMRGPKGPIFETAKIAGIMGAKKTSDLIPLCHPLPLDRVHVDIRLVGNEAIVDCECRVTHKTGVEMEALTGASIAALTIYDMVKAVSHRVELGRTVLVRKSGGRSGEFVA